MTVYNIRLVNNCFLLSRNKFIVNNYTLASFKVKLSLYSTRIAYKYNYMLGHCSLTMEAVSTSETSAFSARLNGASYQKQPSGIFIHACATSFFTGLYCRITFIGARN
jgi:hypothetical protein